MQDLLPIDLISLLSQQIQLKQRPNDDKLHCSSDHYGSLRHAQLRLLGAPTKQSPLVDHLRLMTGTLWHEFTEATLKSKGIHYMSEIRVDSGLPPGWSGTADWLFRNHELEGYVLGDLKTTKGESMVYVNQEGAKDSHKVQTSDYWHALVEMGFPMVKQIVVFYLPLNPVEKAHVEPLMTQFEPLPREDLWPELERRYEAVQSVLEASLECVGFHEYGGWPDQLLESLAPEMERTLKLTKDHSKNEKISYNVTYTPHWLTRFCPYEPQFCRCSEQGITKIGHWLKSGDYVPRSGYEQPTDIPIPKELTGVRAAD